MADDAASVTRTGISYHTKEELIAKIAGGTVAEVKPLTIEQREQIRAKAEEWGWDTAHAWPNSAVLGLLATLAAVEKELAEAKGKVVYVGSSARMITAIVERVIAGDSADSVVRDYKWEWDAPPDLSPIEKLRDKLVKFGKEIARIRKREELATKLDGERVTAYEGDGVPWDSVDTEYTLAYTSECVAEKVRRAKVVHDALVATNRDLADAVEATDRSLAASQATVKELREEFAAFVAAHPDTIDMSGRDEATDAELALLESHMRAAAALARTDDMGALEAFAKECGAIAWDYGFIDRGALEACGKVSITAEQHAERRTADVAAIVARLMRRAGETT